MAYTLGGATGDDLSFTLPHNLGQDNTSWWWCGWYYPTTLTATRCYLGFGSTNRVVRVDTTTSELRIITSNGTTNGQWTTSGAGITTGKYWFISGLHTVENTGAAGAHRIWIGDAGNPPYTAITPGVATGASGNFSGSASFTVGNASSAASVAFQGDIGWFSMIGTTTNVNNQNLLGLASSGAITADDENRIYRTLVYPFWRGYKIPRAVLRPASPGNSWFVMHMSMANPSTVYIDSFDPAVGAVQATTVGGATFSSNEPPRRIDPRWPLNLVQMRRAA